MRLKIKTEYPETEDTRIKKGFLWLPKLADSEWRWLEIATWEETYVAGIDPGGPPVWGWEATRWIEGDKR
jgi:hypothetical protein